MTHSPVPAFGPSWWGRFSADPRLHGTLRASDADRDLAVTVLQDAYAEGRLTQAEQTQRIGQALAARTLGEFVGLLSDLPEPTRRQDASVERPLPASPGRRRLLEDGGFRSWLALAALFNVIWLVASVAGGFHLDYYWPIWPMLGTGIPVLLAWLNGGDSADRERRRLNREASRRDLRRGGAGNAHAIDDVRRWDQPGAGGTQTGPGPGL